MKAMNYIECDLPANVTLPQYRASRVSAAEWRRAVSRHASYLARYGPETDLTVADEIALRRAVMSCPLCGVKLIEKPHRRASKELDHIVPVWDGGRHMRANVRVICRGCSRSRVESASILSRGLDS